MSQLRRLPSERRLTYEAEPWTKRAATLEPPLELLLVQRRAAMRLAESVGTVCQDCDVAPGEMIALLWLSLGPSTVSGVAEAAGIRHNGASILVDRLSGRGLVKRRRDRHDRRLVTVVLTDAGSSLTSTLIADVTDEVQTFLSPFSALERDQLISLLRRLGSP